MGSPMGDLGFLQKGGGDATAAAAGKGGGPDFKLDEHEEGALRVVQWEDLQNSMAALCGSATVVAQLRSKKDALAQKIEAALQDRKKSLIQINELEAMKGKLKIRDYSLENAKVSLQEKSEDVAIAKGKLLPAARSLLVAAKALDAAERRLQDACKLLAGGGGHGRLSNLRGILSARRRLLVTQIAALYPIVSCSASTTSQQKQLATPVLHAPDAACREVYDGSMDKGDTMPMTIGGLHVVAPLNMKPGLFNEPNDHEASATALGYVAHALSILACYLDVPLRYPVRFGASRSYIQDHAPAMESVASETGLNVMDSYLGGNRKAITEFPLFSEGQDPTRSAYAVFLLNKDLEQVLNYLGAESVGPRHTLPNLNKIIQLVCSGACQVA